MPDLAEAYRAKLITTGPERDGMQFEGILRQHAFYKGAFRNFKMYSILRKEWVE